MRQLSSREATIRIGRRYAHCLAVGVVVVLAASCGSKAKRSDSASESASTTGEVTFSAFDALAILWGQSSSSHKIEWLSSAGDAAQMLSSTNPAPSVKWTLCTQGVVSSLIGRGADVVVLATTYVSSNTFVPVVRRGASIRPGARTAFIPETSFDLALARLLRRQGIEPSTIVVKGFARPTPDKVVEALLRRPSDADAIDFAIVSDPTLSTLLREHPGEVAATEAGVYEMQYCIVARRADVEASRGAFVRLLTELIATEGIVSRAASERARVSVKAVAPTK